MKKQNNLILSQLRERFYFVQKDELKKAAKLMSAAFCTDQSIRYLLGGTREGINDWQYFFTVIKSVCGKCVMLSSSENITDLLILFPPQLKGVHALSFFENGGFGLCRKFGIKLILRSLNYENNCKNIKKRFQTKDTWYCMCFVVHPEKQGQGAGSRLIKPVLQILENTPVYLETHKESNVRIYEHLGFETVDISFIPGTGITQYAMLKK